MPLPETTLGRLELQLEALPLLLAGVSGEALQRPSASGGWSAQQNVAHLARYHVVFRERLEVMLREDRPTLPRYRAEQDPDWPAWEALPLPELLERLFAERAALLSRVASLSDALLSRTGLHPALGEMAVPLWLEFFLVHEAHHLYAVLVRARGSAP